MDHLMDDRAYARTGRIILDDSIARCEPLKHCAQRQHCACYMAAIPAHGGSVTDHSVGLQPGMACPHYISAAALTNAAPPAPPARRHRHWGDGVAQ